MTFRSFAATPLPLKRLFAVLLPVLAIAVLPIGQASAQGAETAPLVATGAALDVHTHVVSQGLTDFFSGGGVPYAGADDLIARLDEANVRRAIILSAAYFGRPVGFADDSRVAPENDFVSAEIARYPDRLIGFCGINPLVESALDEIDRCLALPGMVGIKLHLEASGVDMTNAADVADLDAVFGRIEAHDAPVLMHVSDPYGLPLDNKGLVNLGGILMSHPTVRVAHAHCAGNTDVDAIEMWLRVRHSGYDPTTSYVDISACLAYFKDAPLAQRELIVWRLRKWGIGNVLFGSDYFVLDGDTPKQTIDVLLQYPFTQEELDTILGNDGSGWLSL